ncbi:MAG: CBS domain-containing protein [Deltaproteobacteria bacterium]|nr:CBS domain-containing protein [Deltaproteobacteria bacterium]
MQVADILKKKGHRVFTVAPERTLWETASLLAEMRIGAVVVAGPDERMQGIFTERDLVRECFERPDALRKTRVGEVMTRDVVTCHPDDDVRRIERTMREHEIRHLPVLQGDAVVGMVSIRDVMGALYESAVEDANDLRDHLAGHYVVC